MSKYGLKFERKAEACVEQARTHHVFLTEDSSKSFERAPTKPHHLLIEGENYHALRVLDYTHADKIDCIYIDPPYNTGNKDFVYNDAFVDQEDTFRHSKWLSFMEKRLILARELLSERGVIFLSIDDHEFAQLKLLCDEVFGEENFIANIIWQTKNAPGGVPPRSMLITTHEYILVYSKSKDGVRFRGDDRIEEDFSNPDNDPRGLWRSESIRATAHQKTTFDIIDPVTGKIYSGTWAMSEDRVREMIENNEIIFPKGKGGTPRQKKFINAYKNATKAITSNFGTFSTQSGTDEFMAIFDGVKMFDHPKPLALIKRVIQQATQKDSIVLDFFAGSGTTGQAVAELNKDDGGARQFILVTNNDKSDKLPNGICHQVTYPRLEKTIGNENLKYYRLEQLPMASGKVSAIEQLELQQRLRELANELDDQFSARQGGARGVPGITEETLRAAAARIEELELEIAEVKRLDDIRFEAVQTNLRRIDALESCLQLAEIALSAVCNGDPNYYRVVQVYFKRWPQ